MTELGNEQCEAVEDGRRCREKATVETPEGDLYCETHKDWNDG